MTALYPIKLDPSRWKYLKVSPTIANLYKGHVGVAVICADCLHGVAHRNAGLPDPLQAPVASHPDRAGEEVPL